MFSVLSVAFMKVCKCDNVVISLARILQVRISWSVSDQTVADERLSMIWWIIHSVLQHSEITSTGLTGKSKSNVLMYWYVFNNFLCLSKECLVNSLVCLMSNVKYLVFQGYTGCTHVFATSDYEPAPCIWLLNKVWRLLHITLYTLMV